MNPNFATFPEFACRYFGPKYFSSDTSIFIYFSQYFRTSTGSVWTLLYATCELVTSTSFKICTRRGRRYGGPYHDFKCTEVLVVKSNRGWTVSKLAQRTLIYRYKYFIGKKEVGQKWLNSTDYNSQTLCFLLLLLAIE